MGGILSGSARRMNEFVTATISIILTFLITWAAAHGEVRRECQLLGKFYAGDMVFECREVPPAKDGVQRE